jgi:Domain of unknown function (DUF2760)
MNELETLIQPYAINLSLRPTTFDLWHVCLGGTVVILLFVILLLIIALIVGRSRRQDSVAANVQPVAKPEPEIRIVEKIVEVEKLVQSPSPEPVILKEYSPDAALQLLGLLQKEARFIDFIKEDVTTYSDADVGAAARVVHQGCSKAINEHFTLAPLRSEQEGSRITLPAGFDAAANRLCGNIVGQAPFTGTLVHKGWQATEVRLPKLAQGHNPNIVAAAEIEL